jgi:hydroxymethylpyrimidine/phosphomethylpyrimidine kinase
MNKGQRTKDKGQKVCLTIAGLDPSGGAGIIADIKTFSAFGCFAAAAVASLTFQNTTGVFGAEHQTAETVRAQVEPILEDFEVSAVKTGMLPTQKIIEETARLIKENNLKNFVVDPVVRSTSGFDLIDDAALKSLIARLFPLSDIITPNLPEAERIAEMKIKSEADIEKAARIMQNQGAKNVLIKGGHSISDLGFGISDLKMARDFLFVGDEVKVFEAEYIETSSTHGTGCVLAAAVCANLALGKNLVEAVETAKKFVWNGIKTAPDLGRGNSPVNVL